LLNNGFMEPLFLTLDEVLEIPAQQIELYGGSDGIRDPSGLESAIATPMATSGGDFLHSTIPAIAAANLSHICQNHAFVDGNKRTGANAAITFLLMNDWELDSVKTNSSNSCSTSPQGKISKPDLTRLLETHWGAPLATSHWPLATDHWPLAIRPLATVVFKRRIHQIHIEQPFEILHELAQVLLPEPAIWLRLPLLL
jgi:death-on-curing protein